MTVTICIFSLGLEMFTDLSTFLINKSVHADRSFVNNIMYICESFKVNRMKDRIKLIMDRENLTPARFADRLQINRAVISHILTGRNNPSLDVVTRILSEMDYINPEWLLNGKGTIYKAGVGAEALPKEPDLFHQDDRKHHETYTNTEKPSETALPAPENRLQTTDSKEVTVSKTPVKEIAQIIVYYTDQTFETFRR